ncbi:MAG: NADH-quinone oxidoreductase subunit NuoE [candidate division Zixibacteria bacterium]|nr:NADH-quinone oxidoreductase subunit NuoE [candidate division Zixibacteria bacterium]
MILTKESVNKIREKLQQYPKPKSAILPALTVAYRQAGYVDEGIYKEISKIINVTTVEIAEAATFYTLFAKEPRGKYLIQVCHNISCALLGADSLIGYLQEKLNIKIGETTEDKMFTLVTVECLGSCSTAPVMQINQDYYERLTKEKVDQVLEDLRSKA